MSLINVWFVCKLCSSSFNKIDQFIDHKQVDHFIEFQRTKCIVFVEETVTNENQHRYLIDDTNASPLTSRKQNPSFNDDPDPDPDPPFGGRSQGLKMLQLKPPFDNFEAEDINLNIAADFNSRHTDSEDQDSTTATLSLPNTYSVLVSNSSANSVAVRSRTKDVDVFDSINDEVEVDLKPVVGTDGTIVIPEIQLTIFENDNNSHNQSLHNLSISDEQEHILGFSTDFDQTQDTNSNSNTSDKNESSLVIPRSTKVRKLSHVCTFCNRNFRKNFDLQRHLRVHTGEKPFACSICNKSFRDKSSCNKHEKIHGDSETVSCDLCGNLFSSKDSLGVHMRVHTGAKPFPCPHCERRFRTAGHRKTHIASLHFKTKEDLRKKKKSSASNVINQSQSQSQSSAESVVVVIPSSSSLAPAPAKEHILLQNRNNSNSTTARSKETNFLNRSESQGQIAQSDSHFCTTCSKGFKSQSLLAQHMKTHTGERPFKCDLCGQHFSQKYSLERHVKLHAKVRSFDCTLCSFKTARRGLLKRHYSTVHPTLANS